MNIIEVKNTKEYLNYISNCICHDTSTLFGCIASLDDTCNALEGMCITPKYKDKLMTEYKNLESKQTRIINILTNTYGITF